ncbi:hypothetical protein TanjilG_17020 [Lupinus angustifolius]|nr:hypothetical protein TanjilG_17020 [Lupinus angustifolius]
MKRHVKALAALKETYRRFFKGGGWNDFEGHYSLSQKLISSPLTMASYVDGFGTNNGPYTLMNEVLVSAGLR